MVASTADLDDEPGGRTEMVNGAEPDACERCGPTEIAQSMQAHSDRRRRNMIRHLEPDADRAGADWHAEIGADADVERQDRLEPELVDLEEKLLASAFHDHQVFDAACRLAFDERRQLRCDRLCEIVG